MSCNEIIKNGFVIKKAGRFVLPLFFVFMMIVSFLSLSHADEMPPWPLMPMTQQERLESIEKFITPYDFKLYLGEAVKRRYIKPQKTACMDALNDVKGATIENIMQPAYIAASPSDPWIKNLLHSCTGKLEPYRHYYPSRSAWESNVPEEFRASYYIETEGNLEFYDFTGSIGNGYWGMFSEGGMQHCRDEQSGVCPALVGYTYFSKFFNLGSCKESDLSGPIGRIAPHSVSGPHGMTVTYENTHDFFAFMNVKGRIYKIEYTTDLRPEASCTQDLTECLMTEKGTYLYITEISPELLKDDRRDVCVFNPILTNK